MSRLKSIKTGENERMRIANVKISAKDKVEIMEQLLAQNREDLARHGSNEKANCFYYNCIQMLMRGDMISYFQVLKICKDITERALGLWKQRRITDRNMGDISDRVNGRHSNFNTLIVHDNEVLGTLCSQNNNILYSAPIYLSDNERLLGTTFPIDYETGGRQQFLTGMCVPPVMTAQISYQIYLQWLSKIK